MQPSRPIHAGHHLDTRGRTRYHVGAVGAGVAGNRATAKRKAKVAADREGRPVQVFDRAMGRFFEVRPHQHLCPNPHCQEPLSPAEFAIAWKVGTCSSCGTGPEEHVNE